MNPALPKSAQGAWFTREGPLFIEKRLTSSILTALSVRGSQKRRRHEGEPTCDTELLQAQLAFPSLSLSASPYYLTL